MVLQEAAPAVALIPVLLKELRSGQHEELVALRYQKGGGLSLDGVGPHLELGLEGFEHGPESS